LLHRITTQHWVVLFSTCVLTPNYTAFGESGASQPNIVVILADDQGWGDLSANGNTNLSTPHIDSLARDGAQFERFFVCPVCSPTRAEFLTGRYHPRGGVWSTSTGGERLDLDERTIADTFKAAGYATGIFGKWHNGTQYPYHPLGRGFDEFYGFCSGHWGNYFSPPLEQNGRTVRGNGYIADDLTDRALAFVEKHRAGPFFCYLPFNTPHSPMQVPDRFYEKLRNAELSLRYAGSQPEDLATTRAALAMCENIDWNVGRVLARLEELKLADNTIVVYFSDNGPNSWRWNGGMKGRKASTDEGGIRSPLLVRWKGHIKPETRISQIAGAIDLAPTLGELAGVARRGNKPLDGKSLAPVLLGQGEDKSDRMLFSHWNGAVSVGADRYRLDAQGKLFDMAVDVGQTQDLAGQLPEVAARLSQAVADWKRELLTDYPGDDRPFTVGYREFPIAQLPARDGLPRGNVRRSARAPNCSFFENWTSIDDRMTWDIEVNTTGKYQAAIYYTCPAKDLGSTIELSFGESRLQATVSVANDPPLVGAEHDRVARVGESYMKDFRPMNLGVFELQAGRGPLTLRALTTSSAKVMDVRSVVLTLQE